MSEPASWRNLPQKRQLCVLALCRVFDYMQVASFQTLCYYQLKSFDSTLSEQTLSRQNGIALGSFSAAQILTSVIWGRLADSEWCGRKKVLLIGLLGTGFSCIGLAFSKSFETIVIFRLLIGAFHVTIGTVRTMMSENIQEKKHQSRAFLLLPAAVMVASIIGPVFGSWLANPLVTYPSLLERNSVIGTVNWVEWMKRFPYAPPALLSAVLMLFIALVVFLMVEETLASRKMCPDLGLRLFMLLKRKAGVIDADRHQYYTPLSMDDVSEESNICSNKTVFEVQSTREKRYNFRGIWTLNIVGMLFAQAIFDFHMGAFDNLLPLFLSTPRSSTRQTLPLVLNGGLGMESRKVAFALTIIGLIGLALQFLFYPMVNGRLGNVRCFRIFCLAFPIAYGLAPFLVTIPSNGLLKIWTSIAFLLTIHTAGRIFVLPATIALLNNCASDPSVLGTIHGIGQTTTAIFRTLGPVCSGYIFGTGLERGNVGTVWWMMAFAAILGWIASLLIWEKHIGFQSPPAPSLTRKVASLEALKKS